MDLHGYLVNLCAENALEIAGEKTAEEICHFIVSNNAVNIKNQDGDTALICAALEGNTTICQLVLDGGADVNMQNNIGCLPPSLVHDFHLARHRTTSNLQPEEAYDVSIL
ncbi:uncharacterized protein [Antedon mediterranea]|uniref:uncharacterized protein n=1 Tax=Antedon mediterranea TaxID=105859 RepID=UPI003AF748E7